MKKHVTTLRIRVATLVVVWLSFVSTVSFAAGPPMGVLNEKNPQVQVVINIQDRHTPVLMRIPGVVGTATGLDSEGRLAVLVFTEFPGVVGIPAALQGVPVEVEVTGKFEARLSTTDRWPRPVPIGVSTGHPDITAGTIGCRVKDAFGNVFALSNNHVSANSNDASVGVPSVVDDGDIVLQPGPYDGGIYPGDGIGWLFDFEPIKFDGSHNRIDAAIAFVFPGDLGVETPPVGYGKPGSSPAQAVIGMAVQKFGRTTVWTHGQVSGVNATVDICYEARGPFRCVLLARFVDQIMITPGSFSSGGDSGSLIVTDNVAAQPVGLLFAGSSTQTIANPIGAVLARFGVTVDNDSNVAGNQAPTVTIINPEDGATFASGATVTFLGTAMDSEDGTLSGSLDWTSSIDDFIGTGSSVSKILSAGTHTVTASVSDAGGRSGSDSITVIVQSPSADSGITLSATGYKVRGRQHADLTWSGATGTQVNIRRNGEIIATTANDEFHTDVIDKVGGGTYEYTICETDGSACSDVVSVVF
jgi:hypothetical protein